MPANVYDPNADWLFGQNSLWGRLGLPGYNYDPNVLFTGEGPFGLPLTTNDAGTFHSHLNSQEGLTDQDRQDFAAQFAHVRSPDVMWDLINQIENRGAQRRGEAQVADDRQRLQDAQAAAQTRLSDLQAELAPAFTNRIDQLRGLVNNPSAIRSDAEFAAQLSEAENYINAQVGQTRGQASKQTAAAGLRSSGKMQDMAQRASEVGASAKAENFSRTAEGIRGLLGNTESNYANFLSGITDAQNNIDIGMFPNYQSLTAMGMNLPRPDLFSPFGTGMDIMGLNIGKSQQDFANMVSFAESIRGIADQGFNRAAHAFMPNRF